MKKVRLYNQQGKHQLEVDLSKEIARGGEGLILPHPHDNRLAIKLYHDGIVPSLTPKSWYFLSKLDERFIKPEQLLFDRSGELTGCSMALLDPSFFRLSQLFSKNQCLKLDVDSRAKKKIVKEMISMVAAAHSFDVIIGDLNPFNIFVNTQGEVRMLDVDSCETPEMKHSGRLLDEIRDFYYMGKVSQESDYFALAVNVFRLLTYVHPYKGVHKTYKSIEERALKRVSILSDDPELVIPAFYEPIGDKKQLLQFERIFNKGERFLLHEIDVLPTRLKRLAIISSAINVSIKVLANDVLDFYFNEHIGYVKTLVQTDLYACTFVGEIKLTGTLMNNDFETVCLGNKNVLVLKNRQLYHAGSAISNFSFPENFRIMQMGSMVFGVDWENTYQFYPDKIVNGNLAWSKRPTWGRGFKFEESPIQYAGGNTWIHFQSDETINVVKAPEGTRFLKMIGNVGVLSIFENEILKHYWIHFDGLDLKKIREIDEIYNFAIKQTSEADLIFVPGDRKIDILKVPEFKIVDSIAVNMCTSQSIIYFTQSGLLLLENQVLYLINRK